METNAADLPSSSSGYGTFPVVRHTLLDFEPVRFKDQEPDPETVVTSTLFREDDDPDEWCSVLRIAPTEDLFQLANHFADESGNAGARSVALLGKTHSGKSKITTSLLVELGADPNSEAMPGVAAHASGNLRPTTSGSTVYSLPNLWHVMDVEGDGGAKLAPCEMAGDIVFDDEYEEEDYYDMRSKAVLEHLPRLAYCTTDVMVLVTELDLATNDAFEYAKSVGNRAPIGVNTCDRPAFIVVQNKAPIPSDSGAASYWDVNETTTAFVKAHAKGRSGNALRAAYPNFHCIRLPNLGIEGAGQVFKQQMKRLAELIRRAADERQAARREKGLSVSSWLWAHLVRMTLERFHMEASITPSMILSQLVALEKGDLIHACVAFADIARISAEQVPDAQHSVFIRNQALKMLACHVKAYQMDREQRLGSAQVPLIKDAAEKDERSLVQTLLPLLLGMDQCSARTHFEPKKTRRGRPKELVLLSCVLTRAEHKLEHGNPATSAMILAGKTKREKAKGFFRRLVGLRTHKWKGSFEECDEGEDRLAAYYRCKEKLGDSPTLTQLRVMQHRIVFDAFAEMRARRVEREREGSARGYDLSTPSLLAKCIFCWAVQPDELWPCGVHRTCGNCLELFRGTYSIDGHLEAVDSTTCPFCYQRSSTIALSPIKCTMSDSLSQYH